MLDTFYTEVEGWLELADIYSTCQQYTLALQALSHALLLAPQNPFHFLQFAETAYLAGDIPLAIKMFLVAVDMTDDDEGDVPPADSIPAGLALRAWFGVKLVSALRVCFILSGSDVYILSTVRWPHSCGAPSILCFRIKYTCAHVREAFHIGCFVNRTPAYRLSQRKGRKSTAGREGSHHGHGRNCRVDFAFILCSNSCGWMSLR